MAAPWRTARIFISSTFHDMHARFVRAQSYILAQNPALTFQQAANEPDATAPAQAARHRLETGIEPVPGCVGATNPRGAQPV